MADSARLLSGLSNSWIFFLFFTVLEVLLSDLEGYRFLLVDYVFAGRLAWRLQDMEDFPEKWPAPFSRLRMPLWAIEANQDEIFARRRPFSSTWTNFLYELRVLNVPAETALMFSPPPVALHKAKPGKNKMTLFKRENSGTQIYASNKTATLGFSMRVEDKEIYTTAGHFVSGSPCSVFKRERSFFRTKERLIGDVRFWNDPASSTDPDYREADIAVIEPNESSRPTSVSSAKIVDPRYLDDLALVTLKDGPSKVRTRWIDGAFNTTRSADGRVWKRCWSVMEIEDGFAQRGDSGGTVRVNATSELLGHVVCAVGIQHPNHTYQCGFVQDVNYLREYVENKYGKTTVVVDS